MKRIALLFLTLWAAMAAQDSALVDRVGSTGFVQLEAESFRKLAPGEQALAYWLSQASIAIHTTTPTAVARLVLTTAADMLAPA